MVHGPGSEPAERRGLAHGKEWIDTGILVERVNYAASQVGDITKPGIKKIIGRLHEQGEISPEAFVDNCLDLIGPLDVSERTREALVGFAEGRRPQPRRRGQQQRVGEMLQLIVATREFQRV